MNTENNQTPQDRGLSGIKIFKFLPKTNCGECGVPTCLAFAMAVARGDIDKMLCSYLSQEIQTLIGPAPNIDRRPWYEKLLDFGVSLEKLQNSEVWSELKENVYWSHVSSFSGCDMHTIEIYFFLNVHDNQIDSVRFNILKNEEESDINDMYLRFVAYEKILDRMSSSC